MASDEELQLILRRYGPGLTREQAEMLDECAYETPHIYRSATLRLRARRLVACHLLEENPTNKGEFRRTQNGQDVVELYHLKGWLP